MTVHQGCRHIYIFICVYVNVFYKFCDYEEHIYIANYALMHIKPTYFFGLLPINEWENGKLYIKGYEGTRPSEQIFMDFPLI